MINPDNTLREICDRCQAGDDWVQYRREPGVYYLAPIGGWGEEERRVGEVEIRPTMGVSGGGGYSEYVPFTREGERGVFGPVEPYVAAAGPENSLARGCGTMGEWSRSRARGRRCTSSSGIM